MTNKTSHTRAFDRLPVPMWQCLVDLLSTWPVAREQRLKKLSNNKGCRPPINLDRGVLSFFQWNIETVGNLE
jgi:hypothetical protein